MLHASNQRRNRCDNSSCLVDMMTIGIASPAMQWQTRVGLSVGLSQKEEIGYLDSHHRCYPLCLSFDLSVFNSRGTSYILKAILPSDIFSSHLHTSRFFFQTTKSTAALRQITMAYRAPMKVSGALDGYRFEEVTPLLGRECSVFNCRKS